MNRKNKLNKEDQYFTPNKKSILYNSNRNERNGENKKAHGKHVCFILNKNSHDKFQNGNANYKNDINDTITPDYLSNRSYCTNIENPEREDKSKLLGSCKDKYWEIDIILEGNLQKYSKGIVNSFIPRHCIITPYCFMYYKDMFAIGSINNKPLGYIPFQGIDKCQFVSTKDISKQNDYFFQIILKKDFKMKRESITDLKSILHLTKNNRINFNIKGVNLNFSSKEEFKLFFDFHKKLYEQKLEYHQIEEVEKYIFKEKGYTKQNWTFREIDWNKNDYPLIFQAKTLDRARIWVNLINWLAKKANSKYDQATNEINSNLESKELKANSKSESDNFI